MAFIIVKYADDFGTAGYTRDDAYTGYSCELAGVERKKVYDTKDEIALSDLIKLQNVNPSVYFGFVEVH